MIEAPELYARISKAIIGAIPEEWLTAKIEAIFYSDHSIYPGEYARKSDGKARSFSSSTIDGERAIRELRRKFKEAGDPLWGRFTFDLTPDGKFDVKFGYDDCDENGNVPFNEEAESARHFERHKRLTS